jgi:hypothetical protein
MIGHTYTHSHDDKMTTPYANMTPADIAFLPHLVAKITTALAENADMIAADPELWRQDVTPLMIMAWLLNTLSVQQLYTLYVDNEQLATVLAAAVSV